MSKPDLKALAKGIIFSGKISDFHIKNLSHYPYVFFEDIEEVSLEHFVPDSLDIDMGKENPSVTYRIRFKQNPRMDLLDKRIEAITNSVKTLLWSNTEVHIFDVRSGLTVKEAYGERQSEQ